MKLFTLGTIGGRETLGLNINEEKFKYACIKKKGTDNAFVSAIGAIGIAGLSDKEVSREIARISQEEKIKSKKVILLIASNHLITKTIEVPSIDEKEIKEILNLQAGRHTPYSREEIIVDHINLGQFQNTYTKVLVLMVPRETVQKKMNILEDAGLTIEEVRLASEGAAGFLRRKYLLSPESPPSAMVNIDELSSDFCVFRYEGLLFLRSIPIGRKELARSRASAGTRLIEEVKKSLEIYLSDEIDRKPADLFVIGWQDREDVDDDSLFGELDVKSHRLKPEDVHPLSGDVAKFAQNTPEISFVDTIASLIERKSLVVDLMLEEIKIRRVFEKKSRKMIIAGTLMMIIFFELCAVFFIKVYIKERQLKQLKEAYSSTILEAKKIDTYADKTRELKYFLSTRGKHLEIIEKIYDLLPETVYLKSIDIRADEPVVISGVSESMSGIFAFATKISDSGYFGDANVDQTKSQKKGGIEISEFQMTLTLKEDG